MGLRDIAIPKATVTVADQEFQVRGLSPEDAMGLYYRHAGQLSTLFDEFVNKTKSGTPVEAMDVGAALVSGAPRIMAELICIAADDSDEETIATVLKFSAGVQVDALLKIADLTFREDMPPEKFAALVVAMARSAGASLRPHLGT